MLIDTHSHLYWDSFQPDLDEVLKRAIAAGVTTIINVGVDVELSKKALDQVRQFHGEQSRTITFYSTIGIHPHESVKYEDEKKIDEAMEELEKIYQSDPQKVVAIGECGMDFFFDNNPGFNPSNLSDEKQKDLQRKLFQAQIDLAKKLNLPLLIHCRDDRSKDPNNSECWDEVLEMTKKHFGIYHCYSGLLQTTNNILRTTNFLISFAGNLTYPKNQYLQEAVKIIPLDKIVLETDCPFLPPQSIRGKRNEPSSVLEIAQLIAQLKSISIKEVAKQTSVNAAQVFAFKD